MIFVYLYILAMYVRPQDWVPGLIGFPTALVIIPLGLLVGIFNRQKSPELYQTPQGYLFVIYLFIIFLSTLINVDMASALGWTIEFTKRVALFFMIIFNVDSEKKIRNVLVFMLLVTLFLGYQAFIQATDGQSWGGMTPYPGYDVVRVRWYGDWDGPNVLAILFLISSAISLEFILGRHSLPKRLVNILFISVFFMAIFYTNSRGAVLAFVTGLLYYYRMKLMSKYTPILMSLLLIVFLLAPSRMSEVSSEEESARERTWVWEQGLGMLRDNPVLGVGRGMFASNTDLKLIAHNNYVQNFAELGYSGYFIFISLLWFTFKGAYLVANSEKLGGNIRAYGSIGNLILVMYGAATFFVVMELDLLYLVIGLATSIYLVARKENPEMRVLKFTMFDVKMIIAAMMIIQFVVWLVAIKHII